MKENKKLFLLLLVLVYSLHDSKANGSMAVTRKTKFSFGKCKALKILLGVNELYVGCPRPHPATRSGTIYIIEKKSDGYWVSTLKGYPPDFGHSMAMSNDTLVVGSPEAGKNGRMSGSVNVFKKTSTTGWLHTTELLPKIGKRFEYFGSSVAISGNVIVVGCPGDSENGRSAGAAYVFENENGWKQTAKIIGSSGKSPAAIMGQFGGVDISGDVIAVGSESELVNGKRAGRVYIFKKIGDHWVNTDKLTEPVPTVGNRFGQNVKINGNILVVSTINYKNKHGTVGAVYAFEFAENKIILKKKIVPDDGRHKNLFGMSISSDGNRILVGAPQHKNNETNKYTGSAYIYKKVQDEWIQEKIISPSDGKNFGMFGRSVDLKGDTIAVSDLSRVNGTFVSSVYIFDIRLINQTPSPSTKQTPSPSPKQTPTPSPKQTPSPSPKQTPSPSPKQTPSPSPKQTPSTSPKQTPSPNQTPSTSPKQTPSPNQTPSPSLNKLNDNSPSSAVECGDDHMSGFWDKSLFIGNVQQVTLLDNSCNIKVHSNSTTFWITTKYNACGTITHENKNHIIRTNKATITSQNMNHSHFSRGETYEYDMSCLFERKHTVKTNTGYNVAEKILKSKNMSSSSDFDIKITMYKSSAFATELTYPIQVTVNEPMYFGITKKSTDENIKIVVQDCYATTSKEISNNLHYLFYKNKCPLDETFKIIKVDSSNFNFVINAFRYIEVSKAVFIQCGMWVCTKTSTDSECIQGCSPRKRRDLQPQTNAKLVYVSSGYIEYTKEKSCKGIECQRPIKQVSSI